MPPSSCYWTRKLELELVDFIREREFVWKPVGNTNHHIQQKYKAFAEFAARLGRGFTARSVRDRWVNIRSTFNHNLRRVERSKETAQTLDQVYVPCWPLWKPLQFLREVARSDYVKYEGYQSGQLAPYTVEQQVEVKQESQSDFDDNGLLRIRQRGQRTDRPRRKAVCSKVQTSKCTKVIDNLVKSMEPLVNKEPNRETYRFFGIHVTEQLNAMREKDAECAAADIMKLLENIRSNT
ncbi:uncharacterized protein LOC114363458 [Ostrinia furnacalis]|uniref:uncharacterized protein LOC114363458 n=1 Tax=Ostrinia furnacalis TaxID=93504 RepID=UPI00103BC1A9|nr:uncharacterized protein LOC114363458 [Ostrinia furnacalis]